MMTDALNTFVSQASAAQSMVAGAGVAVAFNQVIDLLGEGVGQAPVNIFGNVTLFGEDAGLGRMKPEIQINLGTAFATSNSATGNFQLQVAPDAGAAGGYQPGTWETAAETGAKPASELSALQVLRMAFPPAPPNTLRPRFIRMVMAVPAGTNFTAGTVTFAGLVLKRDDLANRQAAGNYVVR